MRIFALASLLIFTSVFAHSEALPSTFKPVESHQIPASSNFSDLSRKVIEYSERFYQVMEALKEPDVDNDIWSPLESLVDTGSFVRQGVFTGQKTEKFGWEPYKEFIRNYAAGTHWEGTLRFILEKDQLVVLGLEERSTSDGITHTANTVTVYRFNKDDKLVALEVYVMALASGTEPD